MIINARICLSRNRRADCVNNAQSKGSAPFPFPHRFQSIQRLPRLRYGQNGGAFVEYRLAITKFAAKLNFYGNAGMFFKHVLTGEARIVCCTARNNDDAFNLLQLLRDTLKPAELRHALCGDEPAPESIFYN